MSWVTPRSNVVVSPIGNIPEPVRSNLPPFDTPICAHGPSVSGYISSSPSTNPRTLQTDAAATSETNAIEKERDAALTTQLLHKVIHAAARPLPNILGANLLGNTENEPTDVYAVHSFSPEPNKPIAVSSPPMTCPLPPMKACVVRIAPLSTGIGKEVAPKRKASTPKTKKATKRRRSDVVKLTPPRSCTPSMKENKGIFRDRRSSRFKRQIEGQEEEPASDTKKKRLTTRQMTKVGSQSHLEPSLSVNRPRK